MKYKFVILSFILFAFIVYLVNLLNLEYLSSIDPDFQQPENLIDSAFQIISTFWLMVTFRLSAIPDLALDIINIFIIYPIVIVWAYLFANWIRGVD